MDARWYLDINRLARSTGWAHSAMTAYYSRLLSPFGVGLAFMAFLLLLGWASARRSPGCIPAVAWGAMGAVVAYPLAAELARALAQPRPYRGLAHVEVLVPGLHGYGFPEPRLAACGAAVCGLALARRWALLLAAVLASLLVAFAAIYVGADYPSDVAGGAVFGAGVSLLVWPLASRVLSAVVAGAVVTPARPLFEARRTVPYGRRLPRRAPRGLAHMPNARAMEALRVASEAARSEYASTGASSLSSGSLSSGSLSSGSSSSGREPPSSGS